MEGEGARPTDLGLRRWHYFAVLADEMSFTRAAERLYVSQPALSQQIRALERQLRVRLLKRNGPWFQLTAAGQVAAQQAEELLEHLQGAECRVQAAARGESGCLRVAYTRSASGPECGEIVSAFRRRYPDVDIKLETGWTSRNVARLEECQIDIAFVRLPLEPNPVLETIAIASEEILIALPCTDELQGCDRLTREQVADAPVIFWPREAAPGHYDEVARQVWPDGAFTLVREEPDDEQLMRSVAEGIGIAAVPEHRAHRLATPGVTFRRLVDPAPRIGVGVAHLVGSRSELIRHFLTVAVEHSALREGEAATVSSTAS